MFSVLFLCTGNSARSILGEALLNHLGAASGRFRGYSAGSHPRGAVNPWAIDVLRHEGVPLDGLRSKSWDEFAAPGAPRLDLVITVCDQAAGEACPYWPGAPLAVHWGLPDPAAVEGSDELQRRAFQHTLQVLRERLARLVALPVESLDRDSLARQIHALRPA